MGKASYQVRHLLYRLPRSAQQAQIVQSFIQRFRRPTDLVVTDPVLGDNGHLYTGITEEMVREMRQLIRHADIITPNLTELFLLLDKPHQTSLSDAELKTYLKELSDAGPEIVIVTSVPRMRQSAHDFGLCIQPERKPNTGVTCP